MLTDAELAFILSAPLSIIVRALRAYGAMDQRRLTDRMITDALRLEFRAAVEDGADGWQMLRFVEDEDEDRARAQVEYRALRARQDRHRHIAAAAARRQQQRHQRQQRVADDRIVAARARYRPSHVR